MNRDKIIAAAVMLLVTYTLSLSLINSAVSSPTINNNLNSRGGIKAHSSITVYSDAGGLSRLSSIDWGLLEPGETKNQTSYIRNNGKVALTLSFFTQNWSPSSASQYITLGWYYNGQPLGPNEITSVTFTITVSADASGMENFSFDIIIIGTP